MCYFRKDIPEISKHKFSKAIDDAARELLDCGETDSREQAADWAKNEVEELVHEHNAHLVEQASLSLKKLKGLLQAIKHNAGMILDGYAIKQVDIILEHLPQVDKPVNELNTYFGDWI